MQQSRRAAILALAVLVVSAAICVADARRLGLKTPDEHTRSQQGAQAVSDSDVRRGCSVRLFPAAFEDDPLLLAVADGSDDCRECVCMYAPLAWDRSVRSDHHAQGIPGRGACVRCWSDVYNSLATDRATAAALTAADIWMDLSFSPSTCGEIAGSLERLGLPLKDRIGFLRSCVGRMIESDATPSADDRDWSALLIEFARQIAFYLKEIGQIGPVATPEAVALATEIEEVCDMYFRTPHPDFYGSCNTLFFKFNPEWQRRVMDSPFYNNDPVSMEFAYFWNHYLFFPKYQREDVDLIAAIEARHPGYTLSFPGHFISFNHTMASFARHFSIFEMRDGRLANPPVTLLPRAPGRKLRVGFLSHGFERSNPIFKLMAGPLKVLSQRERLEIFFFWAPSASKKETDRIMGKEWVEAIDGVHAHTIESAEDGYNAMQEAALDMLIYLNGNDRGSSLSLEIIAMRPAPLHVQFLGHHETSAVPEMDVYMADEDSVPRSAAAYHSERLAWMPLYAVTSVEFHEQHREHFFVAENAWWRITKADYGIDGGHPIFALIIALRKTRASDIRMFVEILNAVPDAILWVVDKKSGVLPMCSRLKAAMVEEGLVGDRIMCMGMIKYERWKYIIRFVDVVLDTPVYNAYTNAIDALLRGVPLVTMQGEMMVQRVAGTLLKAVGAPELVVSSREEYVAMAVRLVTDPEFKRRVTAPIRDHSRVHWMLSARQSARRLEATFEAIWAAHADNPASLEPIPVRHVLTIGDPDET